MPNSAIQGFMGESIDCWMNSRGVGVTVGTPLSGRGSSSQWRHHSILVHASQVRSGKYFATNYLLSKNRESSSLVCDTWWPVEFVRVCVWGGGGSVRAHACTGVQPLCVFEPQLAPPLSPPRLLPRTGAPQAGEMESVPR